MNKPLTCIIVEDEQHTSRLLEKYVEQIDRIHCVGVFENPLEFINFPNLDSVDIIFMDIQMPGMTGIDILKNISLSAKVILITAYSEFALESYDLNVTDYLLKPVAFPRFVQAVNKAIDQLSADSIKNYSENLNLVLKVDKKYVKVPLRDIMYVQSDWNYVYVHTTNDKLMILSTLKNFETKLTGGKFIKIHKSYIINYSYFKSLEGNLVTLTNEEILPVSRSYKPNLMNELED
jgi:DNA-binding LytR/AlgR family response regulator